MVGGQEGLVATHCSESFVAEACLRRSLQVLMLWRSCGRVGLPEAPSLHTSWDQ